MTHEAAAFVDKQPSEAGESTSVLLILLDMMLHFFITSKSIGWIEATYIWTKAETGDEVTKTLQL